MLKKVLFCLEIGSAHSAVVSRPPSSSNPLRIVSAPLFPCLHSQTHFHVHCLNNNFRLSYLLFLATHFSTPTFSNFSLFSRNCYLQILNFVPSIQTTLQTPFSLLSLQRTYPSNSSSERIYPLPIASSLLWHQIRISVHINKS